MCVCVRGCVYVSVQTLAGDPLGPNYPNPQPPRRETQASSTARKQAGRATAASALLEKALLAPATFQPPSSSGFGSQAKARRGRGVLLGAQALQCLEGLRVRCLCQRTKLSQTPE